MHGVTKRKNYYAKKLWSVVLTIILTVTLLPLGGLEAKAETAAIPVLTFSDTAITETVAGSGYTIAGTTLTITANGVYQITGSCTEGSVSVKKSLTDVVLILQDLTLTSASTAPISIKKGSNVTLHLEGTSTLTDNEDPADETSTDTSVADAFEGAAVKAKSGSTLTVCGSGTLNIAGNAKNGMKGGVLSSLTVQSGTINVTNAVNNGIAFDDSITVNGGNIRISAGNDGLKAVPDWDSANADDQDSESAGNITINGGNFEIDVDGDAIQAEHDLKITNGVFDITTENGYNSKTFNADTMSSKGIKASGERSEATGLSVDVTNNILISGGRFTMNTADDAIHSDMNATITGGTFDIYTKDDGAHADQTLVLGAQNGRERDPEITIYSSYEGLEGGSVYTYSGKYYVTASDDGVNAAGGSTNGSDPGAGGGNNWRPGSTTTGGNYNLYFYGGDMYVNCNGDGLDSNGGLYLYGGSYTVLSQAGGADNSPFDSDGEWVIDGATVFGAGGNSMNESYNAQKTTQTVTTVGGGMGGGRPGQTGTSTGSASFAANSILNVTSGNNTVYMETLPKYVNYVLYSSPDVDNSVTFGTAGALDTCKSNAFTHNWNAGVVTREATDTTEGVMTFTCQDCQKTETKTIPVTTTYSCDGHNNEENTGSGEIDEKDEGYAVTFVTDDGVAGIDVYYTQDYTGPDETDVTGAVSRNSDTGEADSTGDGQINFLIRLKDGYSVESVEKDDFCKNIKGYEATGVANLYRGTKITGDTTITIKTVQCAHANLSDPVWNWAEGYASASYDCYCADCKQTVSFPAQIIGELNEDRTITFTASYTDKAGEIYTDTKTADAFVASFEADNATIDVYYTKNDYTKADETDTQIAVARDSDTGMPLVSGDGQINFKVNPAEGYELAGTPSVSGNYKNIKGAADTGMENVYRITKVAGNLTIKIATKKKDDAGDTDSTGDSGNTGSSADIAETGAGTKNDPASLLGADGTAFGTGASEAAMENAVTALTSDADPAGTVFNKLQLKAKKIKNTSIKLGWKKVDGAAKYVLYANRCGSKYKYKKIATLTGKTYTYKGLKKGTYYKFLLVALDKNGNVISSAKPIHIATTGGTAGNVKSISVNKTKVTLGVNKKFTIKATVNSGKLKAAQHRKLSFESTDKSVAVVSKKGVITAKAKGTCYVYAYAQNGVYKKIKVTVR